MLFLNILHDLLFHSLKIDSPHFSRICEAITFYGFSNNMIAARKQMASQFRKVNKKRKKKSKKNKRSHRLVLFNLFESKHSLRNLRFQICVLFVR